jgi:hypothetical protein
MERETKIEVKQITGNPSLQQFKRVKRKHLEKFSSFHMLGGLFSLLDFALRRVNK